MSEPRRKEKEDGNNRGRNADLGSDSPQLCVGRHDDLARTLWDHQQLSEEGSRTGAAFSSLGTVRRGSTEGEKKTCSHSEFFSSSDLYTSLLSFLGLTAGLKV